MDITYTLTLTVKRPVRRDDFDEEAHPTLESCADWMCGAQAQRELEREVLKRLETRCSAGCPKLDGDCDVEVIDTARYPDEVLMNK